MSDKTIKLSDFPLQTSLADTDTIILDGKRVTFASLLAAIRDGIKVGGRNLIPDSAKFAGWTAKQNGYVPDGKDGILSIRKSTGAFYGAYRAMNFDEGQTYTLSVYTDFPDRLGMYMKYPNDNLGAQTADLAVTTRSVRKVSGIWYQKSITCKCTKSGKAIIEIESDNIANSETVRYCAPRLEIGNIPTDWSPAPEDLLSASGGVMRRYSVGCKTKKGGLRHERDNKCQRRGDRLLHKGEARNNKFQPYV